MLSRLLGFFLAGLWHLRYRSRNYLCAGWGPGNLGCMGLRLHGVPPGGYLSSVFTFSSKSKICRLHIHIHYLSPTDSCEAFTCARSRLGEPTPSHPIFSPKLTRCTLTRWSTAD